MSAADEAARLLRSAEAGYTKTFGAAPLDARIDLARAWIDLARIEAQTTNQEATR